jgi:hypothetical protein
VREHASARVSHRCFREKVVYRPVRRKLPVHKFAHVRFEPSGWTGNQQIPYAKSIMDYIFRWLGAKFLGPEYAVTEAGEAHCCAPARQNRGFANGLSPN